MPAIFGAAVNRIRISFFAVLLLPQGLLTIRAAADDPPRDVTLEAAHQAYEASDYPKAAQLLRRAAEQNPRDAEIDLLLAKTYYESQQYDAAITSAEKSVALEPRNSVYHEWLGRGYWGKEEPSRMFFGLFPA